MVDMDKYTLRKVVRKTFLDVVKIVEFVYVGMYNARDVSMMEF